MVLNPGEELLLYYSIEESMWTVTHFPYTSKDKPTHLHYIYPKISKMEEQEQPNERRPKKRPAWKMINTGPFIHDDVHHTRGFTRFGLARVWLHLGW